MELSRNYVVLGDVLSGCPWMVPALRYAGMHLQVEIKNGKETATPHDERVLTHFLNLAQHSPLHDRADHITAWCSAFVNDCMTEVGIRGTNSPNARSWEHWGIRSDTPKFGEVVVFGRAEGKDRTTHGHVGFFLKAIPSNQIAVLGGNQCHRVMVKRYPLRGEVRGGGQMWVLGYRRYPS